MAYLAEVPTDCLGVKMTLKGGEKYRRQEIKISEITMNGT
jgi:hypothetical protein